MNLPMTIARTTTVVELSPAGALDADNVHHFRDAIEAILITDGTPAVVRVDLRDVTSIDGQGVNALVGAFHAATACGGSLSVIRPTPAVHRKLWTTGVLGLLGSPAPFTPGQASGPASASAEVLTGG
jgi:anti-anti-sigma factor